MRVVALCTLLAVATKATTITTGLQALPGKISAVLYDFDKTIITASFGEEVLLICDPGCGYDACACDGMGNMVDALLNLDDPKAAVVETFGGDERLERFREHMQLLTDAGVGRYIVSTSWYSVPAEEWADFIFEALKLVDLEGFFAREDILPLADPGSGVSADKGVVVRTKLEELGHAPGRAIFADDSRGNLLSAVEGQLSADTVFVQPRAGLTAADMEFIEGRSDLDFESSGNPTTHVTRNLVDPQTVSIVMYDFDKTILVNSFGGMVLLDCDPECSYDSCDCDGPGEMIAGLNAMADTEGSVLAAFGGQERLERLQEHFQELSDNCVDLYIVSTSWYSVPGSEWADFIHKVLEMVELDGYFPRDKILPLADPGDGISADKGVVINAKLAELSAAAEVAIFADDSRGNFLSAVEGTLDAETIWVQPREGLSEEALGYIEGRTAAACGDSVTRSCEDEELVLQGKLKGQSSKVKVASLCDCEDFCRSEDGGWAVTFKGNKRSPEKSKCACYNKRPRKVKARDHKKYQYIVFEE